MFVFLARPTRALFISTDPAPRRRILWIAINLVTYVPLFSTWLPSLINGHPVF